MVWPTAYVNSLPDSSFAWVDKDGNRHLPYKDAEGKVDAAHTRSALSRLNQVEDMPEDVRGGVQDKLEGALALVGGNVDTSERYALTATPIKLDGNGELPTRFALFVTGDWPNSIKGKFALALDDLKQIKANFDKGVGFPTDDASTGLAIDFKHEYQDMAGAWIKGVELVADEAAGTGTLYANPVEWTDAGAEAVRNGRFKCVSPMGSFGRKNGKLSLWSNVNDLKQKIANVLEGAGLTNIPFLRGMPPIRASATDDDEMYVMVSQKKETNMTIDELRVKSPDKLTAEEQTFMKEHRSELSAEELKKFNLEESGNGRMSLTADEEKLVADVRAGNKKIVDADQVVVDKSKLDALEATTNEYRTEKAHAFVAAHVARGAIKGDNAERWEKRLLSATPEERTELEADITALPTNPILAKEVGSSEDVNAGSTAREQLHAVAMQKLETAKKNSETLTYEAALKAASRENPELLKQDVQENKAKAGV
jgi:hypothetical protein